MDSKKSHKERMIAGELYLGTDLELIEDQRTVQTLVRDFNKSKPKDAGRRWDLLGQIFANVGKNTVIRPPFHCDYGYNISIGERCYLNFGCVFLDCTSISLGDEVLLGPGVQIYTAAHPLESIPRRQGWEFALPVRIDSGVWIGGGAIICPGITIGENSVIGAGSVVTKNIPANVLAVGNPCRVIKENKSAL
ncbi:hexapeptide repeat-containing transferase [Bdellovibrio bacteriovorus W]|nr:hexapeptide repeat-containing transferase [Bdellovibrio bacteriovorus W]